MTQWIASVLHRNGSQRTMASLKTDRLLLHVQKLAVPRRQPPYLLTLDLAAAPPGGKTRLAEVRGETPQACAALLGQLLTIATGDLPAAAVTSTAA